MGRRLNARAKSLGNKVRPGFGDWLARPITREEVADTISTQVFPLIVGGCMDAYAGARGLGLLASRSYAASINLPTGAPYGKWRNFLYKRTGTTEESHWFRKYAIELVAFNTFQVPLYATVAGMGVLCSGNPTTEKVIDGALKGAKGLAVISPAIGPAFGWSMKFLRQRVFKLESAAQKAGNVLDCK